MKTAKQILSDITGYPVDELTERNTEPLLQAEDCLTAMYCFLAQQQANGTEQSESNCNIPLVSGSLHIDFAVYLTGHDKETIEQMYNDWRQ